MSAPALITGATSGIGWAFAQRLGAEGHDIIAVGRRQERLDELAASLPDVDVRPMAVDLSAADGIAEVADACASEPISMLVNDAGMADYMPFAELPADKASDLLSVKVVAPTMLARAAVPGMIERDDGTIVNLSGMLAYSGPSSDAKLPRRAVYTGALAYTVALTQILADELKSTKVKVQALCPGIVATEFHKRQGGKAMGMEADDVVTACLRGLDLGEVICAPTVEDPSLLDAVSEADLAAFTAQGTALASRYRSD